VSRRRAESMSVNLSRQDWCTPYEVLDPVREVGGTIDLDPCGHPQAIVRARVTNIVEEYVSEVPKMLPPDFRRVTIGDGAAKEYDWAEVLDNDAGCVFVNHPFGRRDNPRWAQKVAYESHKHPDLAIFVLCPAAYGALWFDTHWRHSSAICLWQGRVQFRGAPWKADFDTCVVYYGPEPHVFTDTFTRHGHVIETQHLRRCRRPRKLCWWEEDTQ